MKLGDFKKISVKRNTTIKAKAEGKKKNLPQKKVVQEKAQPVFEDVVKDKKINISDNSYLVVSASKIEGEEETYVDVRLYRKTDKYEGPTKKGIRIHVEFLEDLMTALKDLDSELESLGI